MKTSFFPHGILSLFVCATLLLASACNKPGEKRPDPVRLDATETANCYIVEQAGLYSFNAQIRGNGKTVAGIDIPPSINPADARLLWQSQKGFIDTLYLQEGNIVFRNSSGAAGNALIAATDPDGHILWSWHIWNPGIEIQELKSQKGETFMSINLGALADDPENPQSYGLLYQWGRKDPFPGSPTLTGTTSTLPAPVYDLDGQEVAIGWPSFPIPATGSRKAATNSGEMRLKKTVLPAKPCSTPVRLAGGFPTRNPSHSLPATKVIAGRWKTSNEGYCWTLEDFLVEDRDGNGSIGLEDYLNGWWFYLDSARNVSSWFPAAARYDGSYAMLMGSVSGLWGSYWSNAAYPNAITTGTAQAALSFSIKDQNGNEMITVSPVGSAAKADAYSIRCMKE